MCAASVKQVPLIWYIRVGWSHLAVCIRGWILCVSVCTFSQSVTQPPTCGGGSPPAPSGHTGSMVSFLGVLHWHSGDGLREFHSELSSISMRAGLTRGISHSVVMLLHGKSLPSEEINPCSQIKQPRRQSGKIFCLFVLKDPNLWRRLTLVVHPPCSESQSQGCPTTLHQSISSERPWDAHYCNGKQKKYIKNIKYTSLWLFSYFS